MQSETLREKNQGAENIYQTAIFSILEMWSTLNSRFVCVCVRVCTHFENLKQLHSNDNYF